ncbi:MAG TPA: ATP-binding protein [Gemmataceae bacterium]|nr:ATP-binding protein [Gemmataceae bacterium]
MPDPVPTAERLLARLTVPAEADNLPAVLDLVRDLAARQGLTVREVERLAFVAEEACAGVVANAYPAGQPGNIDVILLRRPGQLVVAVEDQGMPADYQALQEGGFGLGEMLRRFLDGEIRCLNLGRHGNRVELVKKLPPAPLQADLAEQEAKRTAGAPPAAAEEPLTLRLLKADETLALVRCLYRCYGYTYDADYMYDPQRIRELQEAGLMRSFVVVNPAGEVVGHLALNLEAPGAVVGESAQAFVDPRYRGHGLLEKLKTLLKEYAHTHGIRGVYSEAVTVHPYSQKGNLALGAHETGLLLGYVPATVSYRQIKESQKQRQAVVLFYLPAGDSPPQAVYPPPCHEALIRRVYERLGLPREVRATPGGPTDLPAAAQMDVKVRTDHNEAFLRVRRFGQDLEQQVHFRLRELCLERLDCIYLDLPLSDPETASACDRLEKLGLFFGGVIPEIADGDALRLQFLNNVAVDPSQIQLASDFGRELLAYVLRAKDSAPQVVFN